LMPFATVEVKLSNSTTRCVPTKFPPRRCSRPT
jgi:hypothetical protein